MPIESQTVACVWPVDCHTGQIFCCSKFKCCRNLCTCNMYMHINLLVIAFVILHLVAIFIFFTRHSQNIVIISETICVSYISMNVRSMYITVEQIYVMWHPYAFSDICLICVHCSLVCGWLVTDRPIEYLAYMAYIPNLVDIVVSSTYLATTWVRYIVVASILAQMCTNDGSICQFSILAVWLTFAMWSYSFGYIYQMCIQWH